MDARGNENKPQEPQNQSQANESLPIPVYMSPTTLDEMNGDSQPTQGHVPQHVDPNTPQNAPNEPPRRRIANRPQPTRGPPAENISTNWYPPPHASDVHRLSMTLHVDAFVYAVTENNPLQLSTVMQLGLAVAPPDLVDVAPSRASRVHPSLDGQNIMGALTQGALNSGPPRFVPSGRCPMCQRVIPCQHIRLY